MKVHQIISENAVNEAPGGSMLGNIARKVGAKAAGAVGMKGTQAGLQGKVDSTERAKEIGIAWNQYAGQTGVNKKAPDVSALTDFLQKQKLPTARVKNLSGMLTPKQVDDILTKIAQDSFKGAAGQAAAGAEQPASLGGKYGADADAGATAQSGSDSGGKAQQGATAQSGSGQTGVPKNIQAQLDKLTPQQKKELAALL